MITEKQLNDMIELLTMMTPKFHAQSDGLGKFLGDGIPRKGNIHLRTGLLLDALSELKDVRNENGKCIL